MDEKPWQCGDTRHYDIPNNGDEWQKCNAMVKKYDNEMCDVLKDEVDKMLIFVCTSTMPRFAAELTQNRLVSSQEL